MELDALVTEGLGDTSYVLTWGDEAVVIDPQRDVERFVDAARAHGATVRRVVETHVHNDYVSGALELRAATGAEIWGPAEAGYAFGFRSVENGTEIPLGDATLLGVATPGHTPEHLAYLLRAGGDRIALFSGGSLTVGGAGRTDLLGPERTGELTRLQFHSMRRLADLPDEVRVLPTHGAGSFCAVVSPGQERTSTIAEERATNLSFTETDEEAFVRRQLTGLMAFPHYYADMAPINRTGPPVLGAAPRPQAMTADHVADALAAGARLVDARDGAAFAERHVAGSLNVPLEPSFASYVGWLLPFATPVVLCMPDDDALDEASVQLRRIGWDAILGHLAGGIDAWTASGRATRSFPILRLERLIDEIAAGDAGEILDVRQTTEWDAGHLESSRHLFVGDLPERLDAFDHSVRQTVICASGYRSSMAASLLDGAGVSVRLVARSGVPRA
ncbi:MAG TPA: MBL fold metallo-hydrolase, partial [Actinomycetota bacterium]|nr:MBL fold metallo-hydrolase [Actinomycetota bacterium]